MLAAVPAVAQSTFQSFPPDREAGAPTYVNAEVVRVDRAAGSVTLRSESGDVVVTADAHAVAGLAGARAGDKVLAAYQTIVDEAGRERRVVTFARPASPTSGQPGPSFAATVAAASGSTVRVIATDRAGRSITVTDQSGVPTVLPVSSRALRSLDALNPGDVVGLSFTGGGVVRANALPSVSAIQTLPGGAVGSFVVPPFNGQLVAFDTLASTVTVRGANGADRTFPVSGAALSGLAGLRPGDNLSLGFQVTQEANRARVRAAGNTTTTTGLSGGVGPGVLSVGTVQSFNAGTGPQNLAVPSFTNANLQATGVRGVNSGAVDVNRGATGTSPAMGGTGAFGAAGFNAAAGAGSGTFNNMGAGGLPFVGGVAVPTVGPTSPFASNVPSITAPGPVMAAVLPPATAKAPLGDADVGALRAYGERDFDAAVMVLAIVANDIDAAWFRFKMACLGGFVPDVSPNREWFLLLEDRVRTPNDDQCRASYAQLMGMATGWDAQMNIALDAARRADVLPGRVRETLERHRVGR
jgi:hypothetical protein